MSRPTLRPECYPHIIDAIALNSSPKELLALRQVSRTTCESADAVLFERAQLIVDWEGKVALEAEHGPRLALNLQNLFQFDKEDCTHQRLRRILQRIRHLTLCGSFEFGCVPSQHALVTLMGKMYSLEGVTLIPDPYGRRWRGRGGLILHIDDDQPQCDCSVQVIPRPPTPPLSAPYSSLPEQVDESLVLRRHCRLSFDPDLLSILGSATQVTIVLSLWSPGWTSTKRDRESFVTIMGHDHRPLVKWRYENACQFVARAIHSDRSVNIVGLEQVHPAYLDHTWMPDYEALAHFRERVGGILEGIAASDTVDTENEEVRGRAKSRTRPLYAQALTPPSEIDVENEVSVDASGSGVMDPLYFADIVDRLRDYESSSPASSASRSSSTGSSHPSRSSFLSTPPQSPSRSRSSSRSPYGCMTFMTHFQYAPNHQHDMDGNCALWAAERRAGTPPR